MKMFTHNIDDRIRAMERDSDSSVSLRIWP